MGQTYTRQSAFSDGDTITASLFNNEFDQLVNAFNNSTGHTHDGTSGEGGPITVVGPNQDVSVGSTAVLPANNNTVNLGSATFQFKDGYFDGVVTLDGLVIGTSTSVTSVDTDLSSVSASDDTLASAKAIKTYVDAQLTAQDLDFQADTGGALSIDLDSETLIIAGTANEIETAGSGNTVTIGLPSNVTIGNNLTVTNNLITNNDVQFTGTAGNIIFDKSADTLGLQDNVILAFGDDDDFKIYHNGTNTVMVDANATSTIVVANDLGVSVTNAAGTTSSATFAPSGAATLYHNGSSKLATKSDGIDVTGEVQSDSLDVDGNADISGNLVVGGNTTLGDAGTDSVTVNAVVASDLIPYADGTYDLGSSSLEWQDLYIDGTAHVDAINYDGTLITATAAELNILDGVTATATEINLLDGVTATTGEINRLDITTVGALEANKVLTADASGNINFSSANMTNVDIDSGTIDGVTISTSNITVPATKTLDVSAGTLTLADDQISGDKVEGGTIAATTITALTTGSISSTGNVGVGGDLTVTGDLTVNGTTTTLNTTTLDVEDINITIANGAADAAAANGAGITIDGADATITYNSTSDAMEFNKDIDVTGTVTADGLTVDGDINAITDSVVDVYMMENDTTDLNTLLRSNAGDFSIRTSNDAKNVLKQRFNIDHATGDISFYDDEGSNAKFFWDASAEHLGIGIDDPENVIHVYHATNNIVGTFESGDSQAWIELRDNNSTESAVLFGAEGDDLILRAGSNERMRIDSNGNVIINEDSRDQDFRVESDTNTHALFVDAGTSQVGIGTSNPGSLLDVYKASQGGYATFRAYGPAGQILWANGGASTSYLDSDTIVFRKSADSSNTERMRIDSDGNVGIGVTPDSSTIPHLQFSNDAIITGSANMYLSNNARYDSGWKYIKASTGTQRISMENADLNIHNAAGGSADTAITWVKSFTSNTSGVVFNEDSGDRDFRVESDDNTHTLFVEGSTDRVGIRYSNPQTELNLSGTFRIGQSSDDYYMDFSNNSIQFNRAGSSYIDQKDDNGALAFRITSTSGIETLKMNSSGSVFNDNGDDLNFRVESSNNDHALFVDGENGRIGMGTTPAVKLDVYGPKTSPSEVRITIGGGTWNTDDEHGRYSFYTTDGSSNGAHETASIRSINDYGSADTVQTSGALTFYTSDYNSTSQERMRIDSSGVVNMLGSIRVGGLTEAAADSAVSCGQVNLRNTYTPSGSRFQLDCEGVADTQNFVTYWYDGVGYRNRMAIAGNASETSFNDSSQNIDFRVESDSNTHALFVDAANSRVGINSTASANTDLTIGSNDVGMTCGKSKTFNTWQDCSATNTHTLRITFSENGSGWFRHVVSVKVAFGWLTSSTNYGGILDFMYSSYNTVSGGGAFNELRSDLLNCSYVVSYVNRNVIDIIFTTTSSSIVDRDATVDITGRMSSPATAAWQ
jgi:hypothetical protein